MYTLLLIISAMDKSDNVQLIIKKVTIDEYMIVCIHFMLIVKQLTTMVMNEHIIIVIKQSFTMCNGNVALKNWIIKPWLAKRSSIGNEKPPMYFTDEYIIGWITINIEVNNKPIIMLKIKSAK